MATPAVITLLTDFGLRDPFVGAMKGVLLSIAPRTRVIDISHFVEPHDVRQGGLIWSQAVPFFPGDTVHVAVVDPGVGSPRDVVAVRGPRAIFLAPDNGILGFVLKKDEIREAVLLSEERYFLPVVSRTFHGRDIFAPVAARLSQGLPLSRFGPPAPSLNLLSLPEPEEAPVAGREGREKLIGEILDVDRFGNCITNIRPDDPERVVEVRVGRHRFRGLSRFYEEVPKGKELALIGSSGFLEIAVREGRAVEALRLRRAQKVHVLLAPPRAPDPGRRVKKRRT